MLISRQNSWRLTREITFIPYDDTSDLDRN
jgi:hypothetical protein